MPGNEEMTRPKKGTYHVVGRDSFEDPGEDLYLIDVCKTREEAEKSKREHEADNENEVEGDHVKVYGPPEDP